MVVQLVRVGEQTGHLEPVLTRGRCPGTRRRMRFSVLDRADLPGHRARGRHRSDGLHGPQRHPQVGEVPLGHRPQAAGDDAVVAGHLPHGRCVHRCPCWPGPWCSRSRWSHSICGRPDGCASTAGCCGFRCGHPLPLAGTVSFASGLAALLQSGITLLEGLRTAERLQRNRQLAAQVAAARDVIMHGGTLAAPLSTPRVHAHALPDGGGGRIGRDAGRSAAWRWRSFMNRNCRARSGSLSVVIEPLIIVVVGGIVGFVYIAFFMALFAAGGATK